jgi:hypothetical protein
MFKKGAEKKKRMAVERPKKTRKHKHVPVVVADEELREYNREVDRQQAAKAAKKTADKATDDAAEDEQRHGGRRTRRTRRTRRVLRNPTRRALK